MNAYTGVERRSFNYAMPKMLRKSKTLKCSGLGIANNKEINKYCGLQENLVRPLRKNMKIAIDEKLWPYYFAQNFEKRAENLIILERKGAEFNLITNLQHTQIRSYTENPIPLN
jgi:hypothetical protein